MAKIKILVLGAGFGGLELSRILSDELGNQMELTLVDQNDSFFFGFNKFDVIFGMQTAQEVKYPYSRINMPGVNFRQETIRSVDPAGKKVITDQNHYKADFLVIALGADYDFEETPGLKEGGDEFYSFSGAEKIRDRLPGFEGGNIVIGVTSAPFKCPPAPSEMALLMDQYLREKGIRNRSHIQLVVPFDVPLPPSFGASKALLSEFDKRNIEYVPDMMVYMLEPGKKVAVYDDGTEVPYDLFLGVPAHRVPRVLEDTGLIFDEWVQLDKSTLKTRFEGVYAIGDVGHMGTPKSGMYAEKAAQTAARNILEEIRQDGNGSLFDGKSSCYIEFGDAKSRVARVDVDFFTSDHGTGQHHAPSVRLAREKQNYGLTRRLRWFGF